ncbi:MAG TPA: DUF58 domain-containing protein, partial [Thermoplasmata archaeon]|nr:DUF58 domain-containing protein [Thermoplasmata archaeon]
MIARRGRAALLASAGATLLALLTLNLVVLFVAVGAFAFLGATLVGYELLRRPLAAGRFRVAVEESYPRLPLGSEAPVRLTVVDRDGGRDPVAIVDTLPHAVVVTEGSPVAEVDPGLPVARALAYRFRADERGRQPLGPTIAFAPGPLGLAFDELEIAPARPLLVTAASLAPRSVPNGIGLYTRVRGRLALRHRGYGSEFRSLRAYELSDDIRHVAWRRSTPENLFVREFEQEGRQDYLVAIDVSPSMAAGERGRTALDEACEAAAVIAGFVERSAEDRIGLVTYADGVHQYFRPARGSLHFRRLAENLALVATRPGRFDLAALLDAAVLRLRVHTHLFVFSTLSEPLGDFHGAHARFVGRGHHLYLFAAEVAGLYRPPADADAARLTGWAGGVESERLERRLALLAAEGVPTYRFDRRGAAIKVVAAYGQVRAW